MEERVNFSSLAFILKNCVYTYFFFFFFLDICRDPIAELHWSKQSGPVFSNQSQEDSLSYSPIFVNLNATQLLIGLTMWFSQSEVLLH